MKMKNAFEKGTKEAIWFNIFILFFCVLGIVLYAIWGYQWVSVLFGVLSGLYLDELVNDILSYSKAKKTNIDC